MNQFKSILLVVLTMSLLASCGHSKKTEKSNVSHEQFNGKEPIRWAKLMADSDQKRFPDAAMLDWGKAPKWSYTQGLVTLANQKLYDYTKEQRYWDYGYNYADQMIETDGHILGGYKMEKYNLDLVNSGKILFEIYKKTGDERFKKAMDILHTQLEGQPRNSDGGYWHKKVYPWQMWLDGVYMADPFSAQYGSVFNHPEAIDDAILQVELIQQHTHDARTGLNFHGYDEKREQFWANKETGLSKHVWGRAMGWYCMAMVDILDYIPADHPKRESFIKNLQQVYAAVLKAQDAKTGVWYQVMDTPDREGNYLEATASTQFVYAFAKANRMGYVSDEYMQAAKKGFKGILDTFISENEDGTIDLNQCCAVAGLGGKGNRRDGTFAYYLSEPIRANDPKGVGPFIMAAIEMQLDLDTHVKN
ncbi:MAG: glycoside hydrolase family 105 protein [Mangrovibacterium sp.]